MGVWREYDKGKGNTGKKYLKSVQCLRLEITLCISDTQFAMSGIATAVIPQNFLSVIEYYSACSSVVRISSFLLFSAAF